MATRGFSAAIGRQAILTDQDLAGFGMRLRQAITAEVAAIAAVIIAATRRTRASSLQHEPAFRQLEQVRASSPAVRAYLLFPPPLCTAEPSHAWKQMTHLVVRASTHPGVPTVLAGVTQAVAPILAPLRDLAGRARQAFRRGSPDGVFGSRTGKPAVLNPC